MSHTMEATPYAHYERGKRGDSIIRLVSDMAIGAAMPASEQRPTDFECLPHAKWVSGSSRN
jgi:hypothetical protein